MSDPRDGLRRAYDDLVRTADAHYHAVDRRLAGERASARSDADVVAWLVRDLAMATQFIDLLESAVLLSVDELTTLSVPARAAH